jgi:hypothetical protein
MQTDGHHVFRTRMVFGVPVFGLPHGDLHIKVRPVPPQVNRIFLTSLQRTMSNPTHCTSSVLPENSKNTSLFGVTNNKQFSATSCTFCDNIVWDWICCKCELRFCRKCAETSLPDAVVCECCPVCANQGRDFRCPVSNI